MRRFVASALLVGSFLIADLANAQTGTQAGKSPATTPKTPGVIMLQPNVPAPDFPPGIFTDGGHYTMDDFKGKVLALYFFELG
jgi:hypothetical protein